MEQTAAANVMTNYEAGYVVEVNHELVPYSIRVSSEEQAFEWLLFRTQRDQSPHLVVWIDYRIQIPRKPIERKTILTAVRSDGNWRLNT